MGLLDELKKLTKPYDDEDDFIEKDVIAPQEERMSAPQPEPRSASAGFAAFFRVRAPGRACGTPARQ
jgi:hypothetical protein